jgi:hypothetical protein
MIHRILESIPGPTDNWTAIVGHLAWPLLVLFVILRFSRELSQLIEVLADRVRNDTIRWGSAEITKNTNVVTLDPAAAGNSTDEYEPDDIDTVEKLFELMATEDGYIMLSKWVGDHMGSALAIDNFLTLPKYASERAAARVALLEEN